MKSSSIPIGVCLLTLALACASREVGRTRIVAQEVHYDLSESTLEDLADDPETLGELDGVLEELFGNPGEQRFALLDSWSATGFDPNGVPFDGSRWDFDLEGMDIEALREGNRISWAAELAAIENGDADLIGPFAGRRAMSTAWQELLAERDDLGPERFRAQAESFFVDHYPDLAEGADLFGAYCSRCHGRDGHGDGPMSANLVPRPRDYRRGVFKFAAVDNASKPRRYDLMRTLLYGLPGSAMPSFIRLTDAELNALIDHVRLLSIRGEVEAILVAEWLDRDVPPLEARDEIYELVWSRWLEAADYGIAFTAPEPDPDPRRLELGREIFHDEQGGNCFSCHGAEGRGDGIRAIQTDAAGDRSALLQDEWGNFILPRDLSLGIFRGGERREDIYMRVYCGIPGTPMPRIGSSLDAEGNPLLSEEETWALVDYVLSLSGKGPLAN